MGTALPMLPASAGALASRVLFFFLYYIIRKIHPEARKDERHMVLCVCYLENQVLLCTRIDQKNSARDIFNESVLPAHLYRAR
jgi:hypothetical protein